MLLLVASALGPTKASLGRLSGHRSSELCLLKRRVAKATTAKANLAFSWVSLKRPLGRFCDTQGLVLGLNFLGFDLFLPFLSLSNYDIDIHSFSCIILWRLEMVKHFWKEKVTLLKSLTTCGGMTIDIYWNYVWGIWSTRLLESP